MRISDWSSDVCSSDLLRRSPERSVPARELRPIQPRDLEHRRARATGLDREFDRHLRRAVEHPPQAVLRSEEHTSELQSLMRISYAVFCLKTKTKLLT